MLWQKSNPRARRLIVVRSPLVGVGPYAFFRPGNMNAHLMRMVN